MDAVLKMRPNPLGSWDSVIMDFGDPAYAEFQV